MGWWIAIFFIIGLFLGLVLGALITIKIIGKDEPTAGDLYLTDGKEFYADMDDSVILNAKNYDIVRFKIRIISTSYNGDKNPRRRN